MKACKWGGCNGEVPDHGGVCPKCGQFTEKTTVVTNAKALHPNPKHDACYTLKNEKTGGEVILTREHLRIIICALAGFPLYDEERKEIRTEYMELLELGGYL